MKALIKAFIWIAYISSAIAVAFVILGTIQGFVGRLVQGSTETMKYFYVADSFFLLAIVSLLFLHLGQHKQE
ncbi:MAG: hypothetical protein ABR974_01285 [Bacteroidales bacterium]|jgi:hypothetical protein